MQGTLKGTQKNQHRRVGGNWALKEDYLGLIHNHGFTGQKEGKQERRKE